MIHYQLAQQPAESVRLEILDAADRVIRTFPDVPKTPGLHRSAWDLRHAAPWEKDSARAGRFGPLVAPGTYQARLTRGWSGTA